MNIKRSKNVYIISLLLLSLCSGLVNAEWITKPGWKEGGVEYYLEPSFLSVNDDDQFVTGLGIKSISTQELADFKVTGCSKGGGSYSYTYGGDRWRRPKNWNKNGNAVFDKLAVAMCEMIADCRSIYSYSVKHGNMDKDTSTHGYGRYYMNETQWTIKKCEGGKISD